MGTKKFTKTERRNLYMRAATSIAQSMQDNIRFALAFGGNVDREYICWHLGTAAHGDFDYYSPDWVGDPHRPDYIYAQRCESARRRLQRDFPELTQFKPRLISYADGWFDEGTSAQEANELRLLVLGFCIAMTED